MSKEKREILYTDGSKGESGDWPMAVVYTQKMQSIGDDFENLVVDPIFTDEMGRNLYGRIMTLVEATSDPQRLKAVKDVFSKEIQDWQSNIFQNARDVANGKLIAYSNRPIINE